MKIHHRQCHLLVLDSELDDPYYSYLFINLYESIRKIVQRLQCVFNNLHKPINDNVQDQHAKYRTQSTTNPEIKESTVNTNYTGRSKLADTAITDSTEIAITVTDEIKHIETTDLTEVRSSMYTGNNECGNDKMQKYKELETAINFRIDVIQSMKISKCRCVAMAVVHKLLFVLEKTTYLVYAIYRHFRSVYFFIQRIQNERILR